MPQDLLERGFDGTAPNRRWVADITYVPVVAADFVYTAFVMDLFARRISWAGRSLITCRQILPSMRWKWRSGRGGTRTFGRAGPPFRSRRAVHVDPLHQAARGRRCGAFGREEVILMITLRRNR